MLCHWHMLPIRGSKRALAIVCKTASFAAGDIALKHLEFSLSSKQSSCGGKQHTICSCNVPLELRALSCNFCQPVFLLSLCLLCGNLQRIQLFAFLSMTPEDPKYRKYLALQKTDVGV